MSDLFSLEQRLSKLEELFNLLDALRPDLPQADLADLALNTLCAAGEYPAGSIWLYEGGTYTAAATTGLERQRTTSAGQLLSAPAFGKLLAASSQRGGFHLLPWPLPEDIAPALRAPGQGGHTLIVPLTFTDQLGFAALEAPVPAPTDEAIEMLGRVTDRVAVALDAGRMFQNHLATIAELNRLSDEQRALQETIFDLSAPMLPLLPGVLVLPLIGAIDSRRAMQIMDAELETILQHRAEVVLVDITGVPVIDTSVAKQLIEAAEAARLLGCHTVLVGFRPETAQTLVGLGVGLNDISTRATLADGLEEALRLTRRRIVGTSR